MAPEAAEQQAARAAECLRALKQTAALKLRSFALAVQAELQQQQVAEAARLLGAAAVQQQVASDGEALEALRAFRPPARRSRDAALAPVELAPQWAWEAQMAAQPLPVSRREAVPLEASAQPGAPLDAVELVARPQLPSSE